MKKKLVNDLLRTAAQQALEALDRVQPQVRGAIPQQDVEDAIDALKAALAEPVRDEWKEAVVNELIIAHIYSEKHDADPRKAVQDAISWNVQVALDPLVSSDAQALIDRGAAALAKPVQEPVRLQCVTCGTVYADGVPPQVPVQEPVAWSHINGTSDTKWHPPQRKPEPEPVAEVVEDEFSRQVVGIGRWLKLPNGTKLYTAPPQRTPLTVEKIVHIIDDTLEGGSSLVDVARAIERAHGIGDKE